MGRFTPKLGIDLGTANTLVFREGQGIVLNEPSVVAITEGGSEVLAVGNEAKEMVGKTPDNIIAYRPMKDGVIADNRVTEAMLSYYISKSLSQWNVFKPDVLVSVPAGITSTERRAVVEATVRSGAKSSFLIKEPVLSAIGAGIPIHESRGNMVVDIGGGTTDIAVISLGGIVRCKSVKCAGNKIDEAIAEYVKRTRQVAIGERTAEELKINIGSAIGDRSLSAVVNGRAMASGLPEKVEVTSQELAKAFNKELETIVTAIIDVLSDTPPELVSDIVKQGVTLTGGTSQLRDLPALISRHTHVPARVAKEPLFCVAKGTGEALKHLSTYKRSIVAKRQERV